MSQFGGPNDFYGSAPSADASYNFDMPEFGQELWVVTRNSISQHSQLLPHLLAGISKPSTTHRPQCRRTTMRPMPNRRAKAWVASTIPRPTPTRATDRTRAESQLLAEEPATNSMMSLHCWKVRFGYKWAFSLEVLANLSLLQFCYWFRELEQKVITTCMFVYNQVMVFFISF